MALRKMDLFRGVREKLYDVYSKSLDTNLRAIGLVSSPLPVIPLVPLPPGERAFFSHALVGMGRCPSSGDASALRFWSRHENPPRCR